MPMILCVPVNFFENYHLTWLRNSVEGIKLWFPRFGAPVIVFQMNTRHIDYNYKGYSNNYLELEKQSKEEQERILGSKLYRFMSVLDNFIPLNF